MNGKRILITGVSGVIGSRLYNYLEDYNPTGITRQKRFLKDKNIIRCDLTKLNEFKKIIGIIKPEIIYHFAALTNPKINEITPEKARMLNVTITKNIIRSIDTQNTHLIFLSSDKVFDGSNIDPDENSKTNPLWLYGKLKLECEKIIKDNVLMHHIIRLPIVHGNGEENRPSFIDEALIDLRNGNKVNVFDNVERCYVRLDELTNFLKILINDSHFGIYHAGSALMSYHERISMICKENSIASNDFLVRITGNAKPPVQNLSSNKLKHTFNFSFS